MVRETYRVGITHVGQQMVGPTVAVADPVATTGHDTEVFFTDRMEIRNQNGELDSASTFKRKLNPNDQIRLQGQPSYCCC